MADTLRDPVFVQVGVVNAAAANVTAAVALLATTLDQLITLLPNATVRPGERLNRAHVLRDSHGPRAPSRTLLGGDEGSAGRSCGCDYQPDQHRHQRGQCQWGP